MDAATERALAGYCTTLRTRLVLNECTFGELSQTDLIVLKELQEEGGNGGRDADEQVDDYEEHVGRTGHLKPEGSWVHDGSDGPPGRKSKQLSKTPQDVPSSNRDHQEALSL